jgi:tetratricopeptide (TPR) repeat protein
LVSCNRDLQTAKKALLARGDNDFSRGQYKQASVLYRLAVQKDKRYSIAYYKLALTDLKLEEIRKAVEDLRRAIELLPQARQLLPHFPEVSDTPGTDLSEEAAYRQRGGYLQANRRPAARPCGLPLSLRPGVCSKGRKAEGHPGVANCAEKQSAKGRRDPDPPVAAEDPIYHPRT